MNACRTVMLYSTFASAEEAKRIVSLLLEERLIACANILPAGTSLYRWQGRVCEEPETIAILKTDSARRDAAMARIRALHSYETPAILAWPAEAVDPSWSAWLAESLGEVTN